MSSDQIAEAGGHGPGSEPESSAPRKRGRPRSAPIEVQRRTILDVAIKMFAENDLDATTIESVAREANLARPTVYKLFGTKEELFAAVVEEASNRALSFFRDRVIVAEGELTLEGPDALEQMKSQIEVLRSNVSIAFDLLTEQPAVATILRMASRAGNQFRAQLEDTRKAAQADSFELFGKAMKIQGPLGPEAARVAIHMMSSLVESTAFKQVEEPDWDRAATIDLVAAFILGGIANLITRWDNSL